MQNICPSTVWMLELAVCIGAFWTQASKAAQQLWHPDLNIHPHVCILIYIYIYIYIYILKPTVEDLYFQFKHLATYILFWGVV